MSENETNVKEESNKEKELVKKLIEELQDLRYDLGYKMDDIERVVNRLQATIDTIDTYDYDDEANSDTRRETPWYLESEHETLLKMIEELQGRAREINEYRKSIEQIIKYVELVFNKLNGELDIRDLQYVAKASIDYGYITIKFNNVHLASRHLTSETSINELMTEAVDLRNIKSIIMGTLIAMNIAIGRDMYEGKYSDIADYVEDRLKDVLNLFQAQ